MLTGSMPDGTKRRPDLRRLDADGAEGAAMMGHHDRTGLDDSAAGEIVELLASVARLQPGRPARAPAATACSTASRPNRPFTWPHVPAAVAERRRRAAGIACASRRQPTRGHLQPRPGGMADTAVLDTSDRVFAGILLTSLAYLLFSVQDASIKLLVTSYTVWQILFFRSVAVLAGSALVGGPQLVRGGRPLADRQGDVPAFGDHPRRLALLLHGDRPSAAGRDHHHLFRSAGHRHLALDPAARREGAAGALGGGAHRLRRGLRRLRSGKSRLLGAVALVLAAAFLWALSIVLLRKIALQERTMIQLVLNNAFFLAIAGVPLVWLWQTPSGGEFVLLGGVGALGGLAQACLFEGMKRARCR